MFPLLFQDNIQKTLALSWSSTCSSSISFPTPPPHPVCVCVCSVTSYCLWPRRLACQASLSVKFPRQEYWSGCHFLLQRLFTTQGSNPEASPALVGGFFTTLAPGKPSVPPSGAKWPELQQLHCIFYADMLLGAFILSDQLFGLNPQRDSPCLGKVREK